MTGEFGIEEVFRPKVGVSVVADVVFVHGLFGHRRNTWTWKSPSAGKATQDSDERPAKRSRTAIGGWLPTRKHNSELVDDDSLMENIVSPEGLESNKIQQPSSSNVFWPRDLLPQVLPDCRTLTWGYDANIDNLFSSASTATVFNHANNLLSELSDARMERDEACRPIFFIAHSLGGIIVKDALNQSRQSPTYLNKIFSSTEGVCFLGTPHRGSPIASLGETVFRIAKLWGKSPNLQTLQSLKYDSETLERIQVAFKQNLLIRKIGLRSFRESRASHGMIVVDRFSSIVDDPLEIVSDIAADHKEMAKFGELSDKGFVAISKTLYRWNDDFKNRVMQKDGRDESSGKRKEIEDQLKKEILESLDNSQRRWRYHQVTPAHSGTFEWLFESTTGFVDWLQNTEMHDDSIFWIRGKPGSGKSTIMKWIVQNPQTEQHLEPSDSGLWEIIPFFFYEQGDAIQKTTEGFLQEILWKLLRMDPHAVKLILPIRAADILGDAGLLFEKIKSNGTVGVAEQFEAWYMKNYDRLDRQHMPTKVSRASKKPNTPITGSKHLEWSREALQASILAILEQTAVRANLCLFVDALDEHFGSPRCLAEILQALSTAASQSSIFLKLCVASRPEPYFMNVFDRCPGFAIHEFTRRDVETFAHDRLVSSLPESRARRDASVLNDLVREISQKAEGVFIWAKLVTDELCEGLESGSSIAQLAEVLETVPEDLSDLYQRILRRIRLKYRYEGFVMFQLCLQELDSHISVQYYNMILDFVMTGDISESSSNEWSAQELVSRLTSRTGGLLQISGPMVTFLHRTVKTFLGSPQYNAMGIHSFPAHENSCVYFLKFQVFALLHMQWEQLETFSSDLETPYIPRLHREAENAIGPIVADRLFEDLLRPARASMVLKELLVRSCEMSKDDETTNESWEPGKKWFFNNWSTVISERVQKGEYTSVGLADLASLNEAILDGFHMLELCSTFPSMMKQIDEYQEKFFISSLSCRSYRLLLEAASKFMLSYIERKVSAGCPVTMKGCPSVLYVLLNFGFYFLSVDRRGCTYKSEPWLGEACSVKTAQFKACIATILQKHPNLEDHFLPGQSAFQTFTRTIWPMFERVHERDKFLDVCSFLIDKGFPYYNVLENYTYYFKEEIGILLEFFLKHGANPNTRDQYQMTPLYHAITVGSSKYVKLLLEYGADPFDVGHGISAFKPDNAFIWRWRAGRFAANAHKMRVLLDSFESGPSCQRVTES